MGGEEVSCQAAWEFEGTVNSRVGERGYIHVSMPPLCVGGRAWDRTTAHVEAVVMATGDVVLLREISAVPESHRLLSSVSVLFNLFVLFFFFA